MYLYCVLIWPDDGCFTAETCHLEVNYKVCHITDDIVVFSDGNKYHFKIVMPHACMRARTQKHTFLNNV